MSDLDGFARRTAGARAEFEATLRLRQRRGRLSPVCAEVKRLPDSDSEDSDDDGRSGVNKRAGGLASGKKSASGLVQRPSSAAPAHRAQAKRLTRLNSWARAAG